jgi:hypothetical protein
MDQARPLAYADDNFLQDPPVPTVRAFHALLNLAGPLCLHPQLGKCAVYSANAGAAASITCQLAVHHASDGLLAARGRGNPGWHPRRLQTAWTHMPAT